MKRYAISESASEIACNAGWCCSSELARAPVTDRPAITRAFTCAFYACRLLLMPGDMVRAAADAVEQAGSVCRNKCCTSSFPVFVCQCNQRKMR